MNKLGFLRGYPPLKRFLDYARNDKGRWFDIEGGPSTGSGTAVGELVEPQGRLCPFNILEPFHQPIKPIPDGIERSLHGAEILLNKEAVVAPIHFVG